jgi:predicted amidohydrolase
MSSLKFLLVQTELSWEDKVGNLTMLQQKLEGKTIPGHIIVLPEMFSTGFSMQPKLLAETMEGATVSWMKRMAAQYRCILTGSIIIEETNQYFNRLMWMQPDGQSGYYDKRHLFAFAGENKAYTSGIKRQLFSVGGWKILPQICYDLRFPVWARQQVKRKDNLPVPEYDVLLYVANWPQRRIQAWRSLLVARAIENQCYVVAVNRVGKDGHGIEHNGCSMVVDPLGAIIWEAEGKEVIDAVELSRDHLEETREKFQFLNDSDRFELLT